jgi:hypothetical protein
MSTRYRTLYARLLRLYPAPFRERFSESMEQTFNDLCRERRDQGASLLIFVLGLFAETAAAILRERMVSLVPNPKVLVRAALVTVAVLSVPLFAMQFSEGVQWDGLDFVVAGALLFASSLVFQVVAERASNPAYRGATGLAVVTGLLLVWMNLGVGVIGSEDNPADLLYAGVLATGVIGAIGVRLRPIGMGQVLYVTAIVQALVPVIALLVWRPVLDDGGTGWGLAGVFAVNTVFAALFAGSGYLYRRAGTAAPQVGASAN